MINYERIFGPSLILKSSLRPAHLLSGEKVILLSAFILVSAGILIGYC